MDMLRAVRAFGDAHDRMSTGMKHGMHMNITDLAALRLLIMRADQARAVTPADIARHLRISTASTTKLVDRLVASGHVTRLPHPVDRRARVVALTEVARAEFFRLFAQRLAAMRTAFDEFTDAELDASRRLLTAVSAALDDN
jgi:DNA-binding MarR family transcriptional regulator